MKCGSGWPKPDGKVLFWIIILFFLLLLLFELVGCTLYNPAFDPKLNEPRPHTYRYRIDFHVNNLMLPAVEHWKYVHTQIDGTQYIKTREIWVERISGPYLLFILVYYEWENE